MLCEYSFIRHPNRQDLIIKTMVYVHAVSYASNYNVLLLVGLSLVEVHKYVETVTEAASHGDMGRKTELFGSNFLLILQNHSNKITMVLH